MIGFENNTRNQHFISQVEQRLNALNPQANSENMRIFSYKTIDRDAYKLLLEYDRGIRIGKSLAIEDLYSFDVSGENKLCYNFENIFQKYEVEIESCTKSLLRKSEMNDADIKEEVFTLLAAKLVNFVRNPYSIDLLLRLFSGIVSFCPTNPDLVSEYNRILLGRKPHQNYLCKKLGITDKVYSSWLRMIYMLLVPMAEGKSNLLEEIINTLVENKKLHIAVFVHKYDSYRCLLSDRGYCWPFDSKDYTGFSFNLSAEAFVDYVFADSESIISEKFPPNFVQSAMNVLERQNKKRIHVTFLRNDLKMLQRYNRSVVFQCHERVFSSTSRNLII